MRGAWRARSVSGVSRGSRELPESQECPGHQERQGRQKCRKPRRGSPRLPRDSCRTRPAAQTSTTSTSEPRASALGCAVQKCNVKGGEYISLFPLQSCAFRVFVYLVNSMVLFACGWSRGNLRRNLKTSISILKTEWKLDIARGTELQNAESRTFTC